MKAMFTLILIGMLLVSIVILKSRTVSSDHFFSLGGGISEERSQSIAVGRAPTVIVESDAGNVSFCSGLDGQVKIVEVKHARSQADIDLVRVEAINQSNTVRIAFRQPQAARTGCSVDLTIYAPSDSRLQIDTGGGSVDAVGFTAGVTAHTGGGSVSVSDVAGELRLSSAGGNVRCENARGPVHIETGAGNLSIQGLVSGRAVVQTGGGNIDIGRVDGALSASTGAGNISVTGLLRGDSQLSTGAGAVHIDLDPESSLRVQASTSVGDIRTGFGLSTGDKTSVGASLTGKIGTGDSGTLYMRTGVGNVRVDRLDAENRAPAVDTRMIAAQGMAG